MEHLRSIRYDHTRTSFPDGTYPKSGSPSRKIFRFRPKSECPDSKLSSIFRSHLVLVLGWASQQGHVRAVTVSYMSHPYAKKGILCNKSRMDANTSR